MRFRVLYAFVDGEAVFYIGQTANFYDRLSVHRSEAKSKDTRLYRYIRAAKAEGRMIDVQVLAILPDDSVFARMVEQLVIADIGIIEDGGSLLNGRRSSIGSAGYIEEAISKMSAGSRNRSKTSRQNGHAKAMASDAEYVEKRQRAMKAKWANPEYRAREVAKQNSDQVQAIRRERMQRLWSDPAFKEKMAKRRPRTWTDEARATHGDKCRATLAGKK